MSITTLQGAISTSVMDRSLSSLWKPRTVERVADARLPTELGEFRIIGYRSLTTKEEFVVLARGDLAEYRVTLVRIHSQCLPVMYFAQSNAIADRNSVPRWN